MLELNGDRIRFTHPLLAPVCYDDMPLFRRRRLHRRLADLDLDPEERARHLALAAAGPDEEIAATLDLAATHARGRGAAQAAAELAERAIGLTPPDALDGINRRRIAAADHCFYAGDAKKARALLEEAAGSLSPGPERSDAISLLARVSASTDDFRAAENLYLRAFAEPGLEISQRVSILCDLANLADARGDSREGARYAEAGLALAEQLAEPELLAFSLATVVEITFELTGRVRRDLFDRALEIEHTAGVADRLFGLGGTRHLLACLLGRCDRFDEARDIWRELIAEAYECADPAVVSHLLELACMEVAAGGVG